MAVKPDQLGACSRTSLVSSGGASPVLGAPAVRRPTGFPTIERTRAVRRVLRRSRTPPISSSRRGSAGSLALVLPHRPSPPLCRLVRRSCDAVKMILHQSVRTMSTRLQSGEIRSDAISSEVRLRARQRPAPQRRKGQNPCLGEGFLVAGCRPSPGWDSPLFARFLPQTAARGQSVTVQNSSAPFLLPPSARMCGSIPLQIRLLISVGSTLGERSYAWLPPRRRLGSFSPSRSRRCPSRGRGRSLRASRLRSNATARSPAKARNLYQAGLRALRCCPASWVRL